MTFLKKSLSALSANSSLFTFEIWFLLLKKCHLKKLAITDTSSKLTCLAKFNVKRNKYFPTDFWHYTLSVIPCREVSCLFFINDLFLPSNPWSTKKYNSYSYLHHGIIPEWYSARCSVESLSFFRATNHKEDGEKMNPP